MRSHKDDDLVYENGRFKAYAVLDKDPINPREDYDTLGKMMFLRDHHWRLGEEQLNENQLVKYVWNEEEQYEEEVGLGIVDFARHARNAVIAVPLRIRSYSNCDVRVGECDEGEADGVIYITDEKFKEEYGEFEEENILKALKYLEGEIELYNSYLEGSVYGWVICDTVADYDHLDSCWGYFGYDHAKSGLLESAKEATEYLVKKEMERWENTTKMPAWKFISEIVTNPF